MMMRGKRVGTEADGADARAGFGARHVALAVLIAAVFAGVRLWRLDASCLWFDEVFSVHAARHGWGALLDFVAVDLIHPPLFYLLLKCWIALTGSEGVWWLRLFPVLTATAAIVPVVLLCRELRLRAGVAQLALVLMCVNGFLIQYAREVRMYSLLFLLAASSLWLFARFSQSRARRRDGVALFAVNLLLVYTHYFGWLLVGHELVFLVVWQRRRVKAFALMSAALGVCYSPWLWMVWQAAAGEGGAGRGLIAQNIGWAAAPRLSEILQPYLLLHEPFRFRQNTHEPPVLGVNVWLALLIFVPPLVALGWRLLRARRRTVEAQEEGLETETATAGAETVRDAWRGMASRSFSLTFLIFFSTAPVLVTFLLARVLPHSIWGTRHLIIIAPVYLLLAAAALVSLRRPLWLATTFRILLACWLVLAAMLFGLMRRNDAPPIWCAWETLERQAAGTETSGSGGSSSSSDEIKVYAFEDLVAYHLWYASSSIEGGRRFRIATVANLPGLVEDKAFFLPRGFDEVTKTDMSAAIMREEHFWAAFRVAAPGNAETEHPVLRVLSERGYMIERRLEVTASGQKALLISVRLRRLEP